MSNTNTNNYNNDEDDGTHEEVPRRPPESKFHQQKMESWNPLITMESTFPIFLVMGIIFLVIGIILLTSTLSLNEFQQDYTNCIDVNSQNSCSKMLDGNATSRFDICKCLINFTLHREFRGDVYLYYRLDPFYQNHRRYVKSRDDYQLLGQKRSSLSEDCEPYRYETNQSLQVAPCGLIANSLFNDTFHLTYDYNGVNMSVPMTKQGIAWKVDFDLVFGKSNYLNGTVRPPNWMKDAYDRTPNAFKDEELIVWMKVAPTPNFKKLNRIVVRHNETFKNGLPAGNYTMLIDYAYPVSRLGGQKYFVISTTNSMGGKSINLPVMYIILGSVQIILAILFVLYPFIKKKTNKPIPNE